jgi:hypothetical protein
VRLASDVRTFKKIGDLGVCFLIIFILILILVLPFHLCMDLLKFILIYTDYGMDLRKIDCEDGRWIELVQR